MTIHCRAIEKQEMFVTAKGDILPCCYMYRSGPALSPMMREIIKEENFDSLVNSWTSDNPNKLCVSICDDGQTHNPNNLKNFDNQWKISNTEDGR